MSAPTIAEMEMPIKFQFLNKDGTVMREWVADMIFIDGSGKGITTIKVKNKQELVKP